jgi:hypothetical protein
MKIYLFFSFSFSFHGVFMTISVETTSTFFDTSTQTGEFFQLRKKSTFSSRLFLATLQVQNEAFLPFFQIIEQLAFA